MGQVRYSEIRAKSRQKFDWDQFNSLPRPVRDALNNAAICYATTSLVKAQRNGVPAAEMVLAIQSADQKFLAQIETARAAQDEKAAAERFLKECGL